MDCKRRSLVVFLPSLASGGAEKIHVNMAQTFVAAGFDVTFLLLRLEGNLIPEVPPSVRIVSLNCSRTITSVMPLIRFLRRERPDILLSNLTHSNIVNIIARALARVPTRVIVSQHSALSPESKARDWKYRVLPWLLRFFLGKADGIIAVSCGVADELSATARIPRSRITVIYNPVVLPNFEALTNEPAQHPWLGEGKPPVFLGVGRLAAQKDFATLIKAFAQLAGKRDARLILLGEGPLHDDLVGLAARLGVADRVDLPGFVPTPHPFIRRASVLVMSSRYEGFGNVLVEALACGTPVVSTDCPFGPAEILAQGRFGRLVPVGDPVSLADAMLATLDNPPQRDLSRQRGYEFTLQRATSEYIRLFEQTTRS